MFTSGTLRENIASFSGSGVFPSKILELAKLLIGEGIRLTTTKARSGFSRYEKDS
jgi:hypothetical protein